MIKRLYLGPSSSSTHIFCTRFNKNAASDKDCAYGQTSKIWKVENSENCRKKCREHSQSEGPGCCAYSGNGKCSFKVRGIIVNADPSNLVKQAVYCIEKYHSGKKSRYCLTSSSLNR